MGPVYGSRFHVDGNSFGCLFFHNITIICNTTWLCIQEHIFSSVVITLISSYGRHNIKTKWGIFYRIFHTWKKIIALKKSSLELIIRKGYKKISNLISLITKNPTSGPLEKSGDFLQYLKYAQHDWLKMSQLNFWRTNSGYFIVRKTIIFFVSQESQNMIVWMV